MKLAMRKKLHVLKFLTVGFGPFILVSAIYGIAPADAHSKYWSLVSLVSFAVLFGGLWLAGKLRDPE